jgi:pimeloyl-ACP methyl ester carboxylesterase
MKTKIIKILKWVFLIFSFLIIVFMVLQRLEAFDNSFLNMSFRYDDEKIKEIFHQQTNTPEIKYTTYKNQQIRYLEMITDRELPYVVFIHGAPGSSADYFNYFKDKNLTEHVNLISVDRLGYGYSEYGTFEIALDIQSNAVQSVVNTACQHGDIYLVGHSYGGPVALKMAANNPDGYAGILLLAPAIDPENEKEVKIAGLGIHPWTSWLMTPAWRVAAAEKLSHVSELEKLEPELEKINSPVCLIHGTKDSLVPYENVDFAKRKIDPGLLEVITLEGVDHFLPWTHYDLIVEEILEITKKTEINQN